MNALAYRPYPLLRNGHLQTLMVGVVCGWRPEHAAREIHLPLPDGEVLVVHEELGGVLAEDAPVDILIHGLGGDHRSPYLQRIAHRMCHAGHRVWRVDLRGSGAGLKLAWRPPHAGRSADLAEVVNAAARLYPRAPIQIAGFSLSGNIVLKMLGEAAAGVLEPQIDLSRIEQAIAIAAPIDLAACADNMDRVSRAVYTKYYLRVLDEQVQLRRARWPQWQAAVTDRPIKTIRQFDARYTAPLSGFRDTAHYYSDSSAQAWLEHITVSTKILVDRDDPIVTASAYNSANYNPATTQILFTKRGGHMGYFGMDGSGKLFRWMEHYVEQQLLRGAKG